MDRSIWLPTILLAVGLTFLTFGLYLPNYVDQIVAEKIKKETSVVNGSKVLDGWIVPKAKVYVRFYVFNLTNRREVEESGEKPSFQELGPYTYLKTRQQVIRGWNEDESLMDYETIERYYFEPELSKGSLEDSVTTLNVPVISIAQLIQTAPGFIRSVLTNAIKNGENLTVTTSVGNLLFDGYDIPIVKRLMKFGSYFKEGIRIMDKFALFYQKNGSTNGIFTVKTGKDDIKNRLKIERWNEQSSMSCWPDTLNGTCQMMNGTDGTLLPPLFSEDERMYIFSPELNRSIYLEFSEKSEYKGIPTLVFRVSKKLFSAQNDDNDCFCDQNDTDITENGFCTLSGVLKLSPCLNGAPLVASAPHFLDGDPLLLNSCQGLNPVSHLHETTVELEPLTGGPIQVHKRLQMNLHLKRMKGFPDYANMIFPIFWLSEDGLIDDQVINQMKQVIFTKLSMARAVSIAGLVLGVACLLLVPIIFLYRTIPQARMSRVNAQKKSNDSKNCDYTAVENNNVDNANGNAEVK